MVCLKAEAMEHSSNSLPATTNGIQFNGQLSVGNITEASKVDPEKHNESS